MKFEIRSSKNGAVLRVEHDYPEGETEEICYQETEVSSVFDVLVDLRKKSPPTVYWTDMCSIPKPTTDSGFRQVARMASLF